MLLAHLLVPALAGVLSAAASDAKRNESLVQTLHRKGVHCMDVLERPKCAIEKFEAVLDEQTMERELVTDSLLRLVKLHRKDGNDDAVRDLLRRFWDVGMKRKQAGHVPFSMRFLPSELDMLFTIDIARVVSSPVLSTTGDDMAEYIFTCDSEVRNNIRMTRRWERAKKQAVIEGREAYEIIYEDMDERRKRREQWEKQQAAKGSKSKRSGRPGRGKEPIFSHTCKVAEALGQSDLRRWSKMGGAMNHKDFERSIAVVQVPGLDARLAEAKRVGRIRTYAPNHYVLTEGKFAKQTIHLAKLDRDELVIAREDMIGPVIAARGKRKRRMNRDVDKLVGQVSEGQRVLLGAEQGRARRAVAGPHEKHHAEVLAGLAAETQGAAGGDGLQRLRRDVHPRADGQPRQREDVDQHRPDDGRRQGGERSAGRGVAEEPRPCAG